MAFDPANLQYLLVEFALDTETWRISKEEVVLSDGTYYRGLVETVSPLREEIGRLLDPSIISPSIRIRIRNTEDEAREKIDGSNFENREVTIKVASSLSASDVATRFVGTVRFPSGISWDEEFVDIRVTSRLDVDERVLPVNKFFPSDYPNMETKSQFLPIPLIWGDWRTTAGGGETVPCFQTDSTQGTGGAFTIADHALKEIEAVYLNGSDITANCTLDASTATFTLDSDTYDPDSDIVTANVQGATDDGTTGGTRLDTLPDILEDVLTTHLGIAAGKIDSTAFTDWEGNLSADDAGRRWLGNELLSTTLITELLVAGFADIIIEDGKYKPVYRLVDVSGDIPTYYAWDIVDRSMGKEFGVERDPEQVYANQIAADYRWNPSAGSSVWPPSGAFAQRYDVEDSAAIAAVGTRRRRRLTLNWHYKSAGAESRASRELFVFSQELEIARVVLKNRAIEKKPTNQARLAYSKYDLGAGGGTPFQIRYTEGAFLSGEILALMWNMTNLSPGRWTASGATTWLLSTAAERNSQGYWTDASGFADPSGSPDAASKKSKWF